MLFCKGLVMVSGSFGGSFQMPPPSPEFSPGLDFSMKGSLQMTSPDTLEVIPFTQAGSQTGATTPTTGNPWKFQSDANRPLLDFSLFSIRQGNTADGTDENSTLAFNNLLSKLPADIGAWMNEQVRVQKDLQNADYIAFSTILSIVAAGIAKIDTISSSTIENDIKATTLNASNNSMPIKALKGIVSASDDVMNAREKNLTHEEIT
jgi:hypothetical protein